MGVVAEQDRLAWLLRTRTRLNQEIVAERRAVRGPGDRPEDLLVLVPLSLIPASVVRAWAIDQGYPVGGRGPVAPDVLQAFAEAHE